MKGETSNTKMTGMDIDSTNDNNNLTVYDTRSFVAPRPVLEMYQRISFPSFKIWAGLLADITEKDYSENDQFMPLSLVWQTLDGRLSHKRLEKYLDELQTTLIKKDEFLPQTNERKISSFTMLGPTEITINSANDVTSLKYRFVKELMQILRSETDREQFVIEMRTFISLKGKGGEHAKNILLFSTPYAGVGCTPFINLDVLRKYMGLSECYMDSNGNTDFKVFNRDVLKKAITALTANPYVGFDVVNIEHKRVNRKVTEIRFILEERRSIKSLLSDSLDDHRSPVDPQKLRSMLINYWTEHIKDSFLSYAPGILVSLLKQFRLVDKYINEIVNTENYAKNPCAETFRIFSIATAITQLWLDGKLQKEDSKVYNYAYRIYKSPKESQIDSLCQKFIVNAELKLSKPSANIEARKQASMQQAHDVKQLDKGIKQYQKLRIKKALQAFDNDEVALLDKEFVSLSLSGRFGSWAKKAINLLDDSDQPLIKKLTRRTLALYKEWLTTKAETKSKIVEKSTKDFLATFPDYKRYTTSLNIAPELTYISLENIIYSLMQKHFK
jgi:hypothetical protein